MKKILIICISLMMCLSLVGCTSEKSKSLAITANDTYDTEETLTSVSVDATNVIIKNKIIEGDLTINADNAGTLALSNVTVKGKIIVDGLESFTLTLNDVIANQVDVNSSTTRVVVMGSSKINTIKTNQNITLVEQNITNTGFGDLIVNGGQDVEVTLISTGIDNLTISNNSLVNVLTDEKSLIDVLTADSPTSLYGNGVVQTLLANSNVTFDDTIIPNDVVVGSNGVVNGNVEQDTTTTIPVVTTTTTSKKVTTTSRKPVTTKPVTTTTSAPITTTTTTTTSLNTEPLITVTDTTLEIGDTFNPLTGVTIYDKEDGTIKVTNNHIKSNNVDTSKVGTYYVEYIYVDAGGLQATKQRKVTVVEAEIYVEIDSDGIPVLYWERDSDATSYELFKDNNSMPFTTVNKRYNYYPLDVQDSDLGKTVTFSVRSVYSDKTASRKKSVSFTFENDIEEYRVNWNVNEANEVFIKKSPINIASSTFTIDFVIDCEEDVDLEGIVLADGLVTNRTGKASTAYSLQEGIVLNPVFTEAGNYTIRYEIRNKSNKLIKANDLYFRVKGTSSSGGSTTVLSVRPSIDNIEYDSWRSVDNKGNGGNGVTIYFTLSDDLDLTRSTNSLNIYFYYRKNGTEDAETRVKFTPTSFGYSKLMKAGETYEASFNYYTLPEPDAGNIASYLGVHNSDNGIEARIEIEVKTKDKTNYAVKRNVIIGDY